MAKKLFLKLQEPTIEVKIDVKNITGKAAYSFVGLKCYDISEAEKKIEELQKLEKSDELLAIINKFNEAQKEKDALLETFSSDSPENILENVSTIDKKIREITESINVLRKSIVKDTNEFIKKEVAYLREVPFVLYDEDENGTLSNPEEYTVKDTRTEEVGELWESKEQCLQYCVDKMFNSPSWSLKVKEIFHKTLLNVDLVQEEKLKN